MEDLESQIAKIELGNFKRASSFVYVLAEKAEASAAELYVVAELPMLNPAAEDSCKNICAAAAGALKRVYKKPLTQNSFETAVAQINEELGKLASLGQIHWINKFNCIIAVKQQNSLTIASCGKVAAFLFRAGEFTDISCSPAQSHPLRTFENYATGKIRLDDMVILSTSQLFNYISIDRLKTILSEGQFLRAAQTIVELLKQNAGPEVAFGTVLNLQIQPGQAVEEQVDLENYMVETQTPRAAFLKPAWDYIKSMLAWHKTKRQAKVDLPAVSSPIGSFINLKNNARSMANTGRRFWTALGKGVTAGRSTLSPEQFKTFSSEKKFFLVSLAILLVVVILSLGVAIRLKQSKQQAVQTAGQLQQVQTLLNSAQTSFLYNDQNSAQDYLKQAEAKMPVGNSISAANKALYQTVSGQLTDLENKIQKQTQAQVTNLGALASGSALIQLPNLLAVQNSHSIISYSVTTGKIEDGALKAGDTLLASIYLGNNLSAIYNGSALRLWDFTTGNLTAPFSGSVPATSDFSGLAFYPTNSRAYLLNKTTGQIISFIVFGGSISKPVVSVSDPSLKGAEGLAIDGAIYTLSGGSVKKFQSGRAAPFAMPALAKTLSGNAKIYTEKGWLNLYILDSGNNRIVIIDKTGTLVATLQNNEFTKLADFKVDEKNKVIYVLNDSSLLKVALP